VIAASASAITFDDGLTHTIDSENSFPFEGATWTSPVFVDTQRASFEAFSNASGLTPPRWLWRRVRL
jgi:hypothetical protein